MINSLEKLGLQLEKLILKNSNKQFTLEDYKSVLENYQGNDWKQFTKINKETYQRTKVYECDNFDMFVITWDHNQESKIHNHASQGCLNKVLVGELTEIIYDTTTFTKITERKNPINYISYIDDSIGYHKIKNKNHLSVSLHIYSPPHFKTIYF